MSITFVETKLDLLAARKAQDMVNQTVIGNTDAEKIKKAGSVEILVTKALGVLQENGVYAGMLYLFAVNKDKDIATVIRQCLFAMLQSNNTQLPVPTNGTSIQDALNFMTENVCKDLDTLFLVKQVWEQTLIYARYGAKARGE